MRLISDDYCNGNVAWDVEEEAESGVFPKRGPLRYMSDDVPKTTTRSTALIQRGIQF